MQNVLEEKQKQRQKQALYLERIRWVMTVIFLFVGAINIPEVYDKRSQLSCLFTMPSLVNFFAWHSVWINIFNSVAGPLIVASLWMRIRAYRREQLAAEQEA